MVWAYVGLAPSVKAGVTRQVYALLLPNPESSDWSELRVGWSRSSGFGVYPNAQGGINWSDLDVPVVCGSWSGTWDLTIILAALFTANTTTHEVAAS